MNVLLSGGTGFLGRALTAELLSAGHTITVLTRRRDVSSLPQRAGVRYVTWDGRDPGSLAAPVGDAGAVVNLAGESVAGGRWTDARKRVLVESRVGPTAAIVAAIAASKSRPSVLVNASAVGYYGNVDEGEVTEDRPAGEGFLASLCVRWEAEAMKAEKSGVRVVLPRIAFVLGGEGSALGRIALPFRLFIGGPIGTGRQWFPWVHVSDVTGIVRFALESGTLRGPVNAAAPEPVRMKEFCAALGRAMGRPSWAPVPGFAVRLLVGELAGMILGGQNVDPAALGRAGYRFRQPVLADALTESLRRDGEHRQESKRV